MTRTFSEAFNIKGINLSYLLFFKKYELILKHIKWLQTNIVSIWNSEI